MNILHEVIIHMITHNNLSNNFKNLPFYFCTVSDRHIQEHITATDGWINFYQILFVVEGTGVLNCQGNTYELKKGSAFFISPGVPVEYFSTEGLITAFLTFKGTAVSDLLKCFSCDGFLFYESINVESYLSDIKRITDEYYGHKREGILSAMAYSFCMKFFEEQNKGLTKIDEVALYIEKYYMNKLTLDTLANVACFSVSKLCHDFKNKFNCSVFQYISDIRLTNARYILMSSPRTPVQEVANSCGFDDVSYFCRAYKNKFKKTPLEDRKNNFT